MQSVEKIKQVLQHNKTNLVEKYAIRFIAIFGSYVRGEHRNGSDIDILVDFEKPIGIKFIDLANELERILGAKVDLVSKKGVKKAYWEAIEQELVYV